jgi:hypothetical protein
MAEASPLQGQMEEQIMMHQVNHHLVCQIFLANKRVSMSSDSSLSSSDLQELSLSKRALVVRKKNGITTVNVDSNLDDSTGLLHTRPDNALDDGMTALKQQSSAG